MELDFLFEPEPAGTAVAAAIALPLLGGRFLAVYANVVSRQPVKPLLELHERSGAAVTLSLAPAASPWEETVVLTDPEGTVTSVRSHPPPDEALSNLAFSGLLVCEPDAFGIPGADLASCLVSDLVPLLQGAGLRAAADITGGYARRVSTLERLLLACGDAFSGRIRPWHGPERVVTEHRLVEGVLEQGATVAGFLWTLEGSVVESGSNLENCVVMEGAVVKAGARLRNTLVLPGARVGSGTDCSDKYLSILGR
jgi:mannose-1-phosphate guanylyltransferase